MQKLNISQCCNFALMVLLSLSSIISTPKSVRTQTVSLINSNSTTNHTLIWPTQGILSQGFIKYKHEGIDIAGAKGTPILAVASGKVVKAGWDKWGLGNFIEIKHPNGNVTVYGHNSRLLVTKGQEVKQGQIIAEMGSTGNSSGPHLHFEFYPDGRLASNPMALLPSSMTVTNPVIVPVPPNSQAVSPIISNGECSGNTVIAGETIKASIKVCEEKGKLFYVGKLKQNSTNSLKIPAYQVADNKYRADNGSFSYLVTPKKVEVWRYGSPISADNFQDSQTLKN